MPPAEAARTTHQSDCGAARRLVSPPLQIRSPLEVIREILKSGVRTYNTIVGSHGR